MTESTKDDGRQIRPFNAVLAEHSRGKFHTRLSEELADLTAAVAATSRKGTLQVTVTIEPVAKGSSGALKVSLKSVVKAPQTDDAAPTSVFFADEAGNLTRHDPNQIAAPLAAVGTAKMGETA